MSNKPPKKPDLAIGLTRTPAGWSVVEYMIQGDKVVSKELSVPELRAFALEQLSVKMTRFWLDSEQAE